MTITARAREITTQTDDLVEQTVRFLNNGTPVKDAPIRYQPGVDQASAVANLSAVVRAALARRAADGTTVAVTPGTMLDLTEPVVDPPPSPPAGFDAWVEKWGAYLRLSRLLNFGLPGVTAQRVSDAKAEADALYQATFEEFV